MVLIVKECLQLLEIVHGFKTKREYIFDGRGNE